MMLISSKTNNVGARRPQRWSSMRLAQRRRRLGVKCLPDIWRAFERVQTPQQPQQSPTQCCTSCFGQRLVFIRIPRQPQSSAKPPHVFPRNHPGSSCTGKKHLLMGFAHSLFALPSLSLHSSSFGHVLEKRAANQRSCGGSGISIFQVRSQPGRNLIKQLAQAWLRNWVTSY